MAAIYQLKVTLSDSKPPIWRRLQVPADVTLAKLHHILQVSMGWTNSHLHQFRVGEQSYGVPHPDDFEDMIDERKVKLSKVAPKEKSKLVYEYDFGDDWRHAILVEKVLDPEPGVHYPRCVKGKRNGPPEDCGGVWGYSGLLETLADPRSPDHAEMLEWVGGAFDPEAFDLEELNAELKRIR